jgi:putative transposase
MPKQRLSDEQILTVVKQLEAGRTAAEMAREVGVSQHTIYAWKAKFGGDGVERCVEAASPGR